MPSGDKCKIILRGVGVYAEFKSFNSHFANSAAFFSDHPLKNLLRSSITREIYCNGSQEWWQDIEHGKVPLKHISEEIIKTYVVGQDPSPVDNGFTLLLKDGSTYKGYIYDYTKKEDKKLFKIGAIVKMVYEQDEKKEVN